MKIASGSSGFGSDHGLAGMGPFRAGTAFPKDREELGVKLDEEFGPLE